MRDAGPTTLAARRSSRRRAIFVDNPVSSMKTSPAGSRSSWPVPASLQDIGALLLERVCGLFFNLQPCRPSQALKALRLIRTDCSLSSRFTISFSVMSLRSSISPR